MGDLSSIAAFHFRTFILEDATWEHLDRHALPTMVPTTKSQLDFLVWWFLWWFTQGSSWRHKKKNEEFSQICSPKTSSVSSQNMSFWAWACSKWENILKQSSYLASGSSGHHHIQFQLLWGIGCFGCWAAYCTRSVSMLETSVMKHLKPSPVQSVW